MNLYERILMKVDPLKYGRRKGMKVGRNVSLAGKGGVSFGTEPYLITLDDEVRISGNVKFFTHDGGTWAFRDLDEYKGVAKYGAIHVGARTFIGNGVLILPGVTIGKRCVIGAGAVVTKDVPDGSVVAGNPAKIIGSTEEYAEKCKKKWDDYDEEMENYHSDKKKYLLSRYMK